MVSDPLQEFGLILIVFFPILALLTVCLRTYSRLRFGQFGCDDGLIVLAMLIGLVQTHLMWKFMKYNYIGIHIADRPLDYDQLLARKYNWAVQIPYNLELGLVKNSSLIFLLRLSVHRQHVRWTIWTTIILNTMLMIGILFIVIFQCTPIAFNWDLSIEGGHCINRPVFFITTSIQTIITDILVLSIPFWILLGINMERRVKIAVLSLFLLGGIVTIIGIIRLWLLIKGLYGHHAPEDDVTYDIGFVTSAIETSLAVITASAAALKPLARIWFPSLFSSTSTDSKILKVPYVGFKGSGELEFNPATWAALGSRKSFARDISEDRLELTDILSTTHFYDNDSSFDEHGVMTKSGIVKTSRASLKYGDV